MGSAGTSFFERHGDYCGGAAFVDVDLGGEVLAGPGFAQHLSLHDGAMSVRGGGVSVRLLAWHARDVLAIEVEDRRPRPQPIQVSLRMLRFASPHSGPDHEKRVRERANAVRTLDHLATSRLHARGEGIALTQEFEEGGTPPWPRTTAAGGTPSGPRASWTCAARTALPSTSPTTTTTFST